MSPLPYRFTFNHVAAVELRRLAMVVPLCAMLLLEGCDQTFEGGHQNTPQGNYDAFFYELQHNYAYRNYTFENGRSLGQIQNLLRPRVTSAPTWENLAKVLAEVLDKHIADPHVYSVYSPVSEQGHLNLRRKPDKSDIDEYIPSLPAFNRFLTTIVTLNDASFAYLSKDKAAPVLYGLITVGQRKIGYIYVAAVTYDGGDDAGGTERLANPGKIFETLADDIVADLTSKGATQLILDIRSSAGGAPYNGMRIASRFVTRRKKYMVSHLLVRPGSEEVHNEYIEPAGNRALAGKDLAVLANSNTCSAGEMLVLMLQQADGFVGRWGVPTQGCPGTVIDRELPNGWIFRVTSSRTYGADGTDYFKKGLQPIDKSGKATKTYHKGYAALEAAITALLAL